MTTKKLTRLSVLTAVSLIIFIIEAQLPPIAPIPGIKLGLANVITLITLVWFGRKEAFVVLTLRITLGSIFAGTMMSFVYSMSGGLICFAVMSVLFTFLKKDKIWVISVFGAVAHNAGQLAAAVIITSVRQIAVYFPVLIISAVITGAFTGICAQNIIKRREVKNGGEEH